MSLGQCQAARRDRLAWSLCRPTCICNIRTCAVAAGKKGSTKGEIENDSPTARPSVQGSDDFAAVPLCDLLGAFHFRLINLPNLRSIPTQPSTSPALPKLSAPCPSKLSILGWLCCWWAAYAWLRLQVSSAAYSKQVSVLLLLQGCILLRYCMCPTTSSSIHPPMLVQAPHATHAYLNAVGAALLLHRCAVYQGPRTKCRVHQADKLLPDRLPFGLFCHRVHSNPGQLNCTRCRWRTE